MTEEEAKEKLKEYNSRVENTFCPLINLVCNHQCVCYTTPYIRKSGNEFYTYKGGCNNYMFFGGNN